MYLITVMIGMLLNAAIKKARSSIVTSVPFLSRVVFIRPSEYSGRSFRDSGRINCARELLWAQDLCNANSKVGKWLISGLRAVSVEGMDGSFEHLVPPCLDRGCDTTL